MAALRALHPDRKSARIYAKNGCGNATPEIGRFRMRPPGASLRPASRAAARRSHARPAGRRPTSTAGNTTSLTALQPKRASSWPDENEPIAIVPNTRKSLNA